MSDRHTVQPGQIYRAVRGMPLRLRVAEIHGDKAAVEWLDDTGTPYSHGAVPVTDLNANAVTLRGKNRRRGYALDNPKSLRRLVAVECRTASGEPDGTHLSVEEWSPRWGEWLTSMSLCGQSAEQGALDPTTPIDCQACEGLRDGYERALAGRPTAEQDELAKLNDRLAKAEAERDRYAHVVAAIPDGNNAALLARVRSELSTARGKLYRIEEMAGAWEQRFPDVIRTAAVAEALHIVIKEQ